MKIAEIFQSRQGEGLLTGERCAFVRLSGCNLRCWFCDTPYTSWEPEGTEQSIDEIVREVEWYGYRSVVITGGEPMIFAEVVDLSKRFAELRYHITIETAGTRYLPVVCDLISISPKFASSAPSAETHAVWHQLHEERRHAPQVVERLIREYTYQVKFVIDTPAELSLVEQYMRDFPELDRTRVLLMPQGTQVEELQAKEAWLNPYCKEHGLRCCPRMQIEWYGLTRGT